MNTHLFRFGLSPLLLSRGFFGDVGALNTACRSLADMLLFKLLFRLPVMLAALFFRLCFDEAVGVPGVLPLRRREGDSGPSNEAAPARDLRRNEVRKRPKPPPPLLPLLELAPPDDRRREPTRRENSRRKPAAPLNPDPPLELLCECPRPVWCEVSCIMPDGSSSSSSDPTPDVTERVEKERETSAWELAARLWCPPPPLPPPLAAVLIR